MLSVSSQFYWRWQTYPSPAYWVLNKVIPKFWVPVQISRNTIWMLSLLEARLFLAPIFLPIRSGNDIVIFWSSDWRDSDTKWIICIWTLEYPYLNLNTRSDIGYRYRYNRHIKHYCVRLNLRKEKKRLSIFVLVISVHLFASLLLAELNCQTINFQRLGLGTTVHGTIIGISLWVCLFCSNLCDDGKRAILVRTHLASIYILLHVLSSSYWRMLYVLLLKNCSNFWTAESATFLTSHHVNRLNWAMKAKQYSMICGRCWKKKSNWWVSAWVCYPCYSGHGGRVLLSQDTSQFKVHWYWTNSNSSLLPEVHQE